MKLVCVQKKNSRRKQAISSHNPYCFVSFLGGPFKFTADGLSSPSLEPHLKSKLICVHYSFTFLFDNNLLVVPHVDTVTTNKWSSSNLKGETEGLLVAAQGN